MCAYLKNGDLIFPQDGHRHTHTHTCMSTYITCMHAYMCVCVCVFVHVHMHAQTLTDNHTRNAVQSFRLPGDNVHRVKHAYLYVQNLHVMMFDVMH